MSTMQACSAAPSQGPASADERRDSVLGAPAVVIFALTFPMSHRRSPIDCGDAGGTRDLVISSWILSLSLPLAAPLAILFWPAEPVSAAAWGGLAHVTVFAMWPDFSSDTARRHWAEARHRLRRATRACTGNVSHASQ